MDVSFCFVYNKLRMVICTYQVSFFLSTSCLSEDLFIFTNSVDPGEIKHYAAYHLGLHCLQKFLYRGF